MFHEKEYFCPFCGTKVQKNQLVCGLCGSIFVSKYTQNSGSIWPARVPEIDENIHYKEFDDYRTASLDMLLEEWCLTREKLNDIISPIPIPISENPWSWATRQPAVSVFVVPPNLLVLEQRLAGRGTESARTMETRLRNARGEIEAARHYQYLIVNDDLDAAAEALTSIVRAERCRLGRLGSAGIRLE